MVAGRILWTALGDFEVGSSSRPENGQFVDMQANTATFTAVLVMRCLSDNRRYASGIVALNADAAREVWQAAREEHKTAEA